MEKCKECNTYRFVIGDSRTLEGYKPCKECIKWVEELHNE